MMMQVISVCVCVCVPVSQAGKATPGYLTGLVGKAEARRENGLRVYARLPKGRRNRADTRGAAAAARRDEHSQHRHASRCHVSSHQPGLSVSLPGTGAAATAAAAPPLHLSTSPSYTLSRTSAGIL